MEERFETFTSLINRISRNIRRIKNHEMEQYNLRSVHVSCLYYLYLKKGRTSTDLCERCQEDKATISRAIEYLENNGYLICQSKSAKRYKSPLILTPLGEEVAKKITDKVSGVLQSIDHCLTEEERVAFYSSLTLISQGLDSVASKYDK